MEGIKWSAPRGTFTACNDLYSTSQEAHPFTARQESIMATEESRHEIFLRLDREFETSKESPLHHDNRDCECKHGPDDN